MNPRPHNDFIVSLAGPNIDITIINIEEMELYCKSRNRFANVVTEKQTYGELDKMNYSLIMNYTKAKPRVVNASSKPYLQVYSALSEKYRGGLLIAESDTLSDPISELFCNNGNWQNNDVDIMICRNGFGSMTKDEMQAANLLRISADPELDYQVFLKIQEVYQAKTMALMIAQLFVNEQFDTIKTYIDSHSERYSNLGMTDYVDYYELNKQLAYFIWYDVTQDKILNVPRDTLIAFIKKMGPSGLIPIPEEQVEPYAEMITL